MRKIFFVLALLITAFTVNAQVFTKPNNGYGTWLNRGRYDSTLYFATTCGTPTNATWLFSQGFNGNGEKPKLAALLYDSCGHTLYVWDPSTQTWASLGSGSTGTLTDSLSSTYIPYWDISGTPRFKNSPLSTTEGVVAIHGNNVLYFGGVGAHGSSYASWADTSGTQVFNIGEYTAIRGAGTPDDMLFFQGTTTGKTIFDHGGDPDFTILNGAVQPFVGTLVTRPSSPEQGYMYYDIDTACLVIYKTGIGWRSICGASGGKDFGKTDTLAAENRSFNVNQFDFNISNSKTFSLESKSQSGDTVAQVSANAATAQVVTTIANLTQSSTTYHRPESIQLISPFIGLNSAVINVSAIPIGVKAVNLALDASDNLIKDTSSSGGGGSAGLQTVISNDPKLTVNNQINVNGHTINFDSSASFQFNTFNGVNSNASVVSGVDSVLQVQAVGDPGSGVRSTFIQVAPSGIFLAPYDLLINPPSPGYVWTIIDTATGKGKWLPQSGGSGSDTNKVDKSTLLTVGPLTQDLSANRAFLTNVQDALQVINKGDAPSVQVGLYSARPVTETHGALYIVSDSFYRTSIYDAVAASWLWIAQGTFKDTLYAARPLYVQPHGVGDKDSLKIVVDTPIYNANKIQSVNVAATTPTNGQILAYNTTNSRYEPVTPSAGGTTAGVSGSVQIKSATTGTFGNAKNVIADSATGKLSADTLTAHDVRSDTLKLNYSGYWNFANILEGYGHSMMQGQNASLKYFIFNAVQPFPDSTFRNRIAVRLSLPDNNHGYSGTGAMDAAMIAMVYQNPANRALTLVLDGWNNIQNTTPQVPNTYNKIINSNKFMFVNANLKRWKGAGSTDSVTTYGASWANYTNTATAASPSAILSVPLKETKSGSAKIATAAGDSIVWVSPVDSGFVVEVGGWKSSGSIIDIYIDNVLSRTVNTNGQTDSVNTDIFVLGKVTMPIIFTGLSMASHRVKIVNTTAGKLLVDFFGNLRDPKYSYPFIIMHDPDHGGTKTNIVTNNGKQDSLVADLQAKGFPAITFRTNDYLINATDFNADSIHFNDNGTLHIANGFNTVYSSHVPQGSVGTMTFSNAVHERYSDELYAYRRMATTADLNRMYSSVPDVFTQDQYIYMSAHHLNIIDTSSGHFMRVPNISISDSSSNTYFLFNARNRFTDNATGIRIFSSSPASIPDFFLMGFNSSSFGGSTTSSKPGFAFAFDSRPGVTMPMRFLTHPTGTTTDVVAGGIHESGGWEFGSNINNTDDQKAWVRITRGTTTRTGLILDSAALLITPTKGALENTGDSINWTDRNGVRKRLATTDMIATSGHYLPTSASNTNVASVTLDSASYTVIDNTVTGRFSGTVSATAGGVNTLFHITAPLTNTTWSTGPYSGTGTCYDITTGISTPIVLYFSSATEFNTNFLPATTNTYNYVITYQFDKR